MHLVAETIVPVDVQVGRRSGILEDARGFSARSCPGDLEEADPVTAHVGQHDPAVKVARVGELVAGLGHDDDELRGLEGTRLWLSQEPFENVDAVDTAAITLDVGYVPLDWTIAEPPDDRLERDASRRGGNDG